MYLVAYKINDRSDRVECEDFPDEAFDNKPVEEITYGEIQKALYEWFNWTYAEEEDFEIINICKIKST